eukprot:bmy_16733T0
MKKQELIENHGCNLQKLLKGNARHLNLHFQSLAQQNILKHLKQKHRALKCKDGSWAVSPFLGRCGEADSPMSPGGSDGTDCAVGEQKPRRVSGAEPRRPPAAAWAGRRPQGPAEDEGKGGREAKTGSPGAGSPLVPPGPQPGSRCEPRCVAGLRFRVGPRSGRRCSPRSAHSRSAPPPRSGPGQAVAARLLPGPHG